jgi:hypothetical protein
MKTPASLLTLLFLGACSRAFTASQDARSALPPPEAFECVMKAFEAEGYRRTSHDRDEFRTSARKENREIRLSNIYFQRAFDVLAVDIGSGSSGETEMKIEASTVAQFFNQRGTTEEAQKTSEAAQAAARAIASRCGG